MDGAHGTVGGPKEGPIELRALATWNWQELARTNKWAKGASRQEMPVLTDGFAVYTSGNRRIGSVKHPRPSNEWRG